MAALKRTETGLWAARKVIPADVRAAYGKREEKKTWPAELPTGQAKAEYGAWLTGVEDRIALLRAASASDPVHFTQRQCRALAGEWYKAQVAQHEDDPGRAVDWEITREQMEPDDPAEREAGLVKATDWLIAERDLLLRESGLHLRAGPAAMLLQEMGHLALALCDLMQRRAEGDYGADPLEATLPQLVTEPTQPKAVVSLTALFEDYEKAGALSPHTARKWRSVVASFVQHLGHDDAAKVTRADAHAWFDALILRGLSVRTVRMTYRAAVARVFAVGVQKGRLESNPMERLEVFGPKAVQTRRKDISDSEAQTILKAALGPQPKGLSSVHASARRWVPWICAYTGARVNEITQLRAMDILQIDGVWAFHITPEAGSVKNRKARSVPIHSHLIEQGITEFAKEGDATPLFYQPSAARGEKGGHPLHTQMGSKLAKWVRELGVTEVEAPNHGWRHRFKTLARRVGMDPEARDAIQGHAPKTEGQAYGHWPADALRSELEKLGRYLPQTAD